MKEKSNHRALLSATCEKKLKDGARCFRLTKCEWLSASPAGQSRIFSTCSASCWENLFSLDAGMGSTPSCWYQSGLDCSKCVTNVAKSSRGIALLAFWHTSTAHTGTHTDRQGFISVDFAEAKGEPGVSQSAYDHHSLLMGVKRNR